MCSIAELHKELPSALLSLLSARQPAALAPSRLQLAAALHAPAALDALAAVPDTMKPLLLQHAFLQNNNTLALADYKPKRDDHDSDAEYDDTDDIVLPDETETMYESAGVGLGAGRGLGARSTPTRRSTPRPRARGTASGRERLGRGESAVRVPTLRQEVPLEVHSAPPRERGVRRQGARAPVSLLLVPRQAARQPRRAHPQAPPRRVVRLRQQQGAPQQEDLLLRVVLVHALLVHNVRNGNVRPK
ncbi:hypothetical protein RR48_08448 [Papilio machaon]|uniref:Uncharacterized protein n=1 Tax=Papilio machaon TaxID=76193 RepID=A0A194QR37_PAPMA|nr:hypothetical protein RR48_08448 [Papilio machaon]